MQPDDAYAVVLKMKEQYFFPLFQVEIYTDTAAGYITIETNGGNGNKGQNGANGRKGGDSQHKVTSLQKKTTQNKTKQNSNNYNNNIIKC